MHNLTPLSGILGGALIGFSAAMLTLLTGRIAGISGIFGGLLAPAANDRGWRIAFIAGLIAASLIASFFTGAALPSPAMPASLIVIIVAGLLVGFGTRIGGGCTSGHGVCGIARLSARSLIATAIFIAAAIATVAIVRHVIGG
ncbi:MAG TPA: YeeE/YedE thiosulfate transporter family protein [Afipia sp.]